MSKKLIKTFNYLSFSLEVNLNFFKNSIILGSVGTQDGIDVNNSDVLANQR